MTKYYRVRHWDMNKIEIRNRIDELHDLRSTEIAAGRVNSPEATTAAAGILTLENEYSRIVTAGAPKRTPDEITASMNRTWRENEEEADPNWRV